MISPVSYGETQTYHKAGGINRGGGQSHPHQTRGGKFNEGHAYIFWELAIKRSQ